MLRRCSLSLPRTTIGLHSSAPCSRLTIVPLVQTSIDRILSRRTKYLRICSAKIIASVPKSSSLRNCYMRSYEKTPMIKTSDCVGIILAGGTGSRLFPCTKVTNKHLLPIGEMPMIFYPLKKLVGAGITDILIVTGTEHMGDFISLLGSGKDFGCRLTYRVQDEAGGIA